MILKFMKKIEKPFLEGEKLNFLYPLFDMTMSLVFVSPKKTEGGAHVRDYYDVKRLMISVIFAGIPALFFGIYNAGYQHFASMGQDASFFQCIFTGASYVLPILLVAYGVGGIWEMLFAVVRKHEVNEGLLVSGFLIPLIVPPTIPLWQIAVATSFGIVVGKELFGGTGMNIFNPALVTRAFLFFAYPASISGDSVWTALGPEVIDAYTGATPLAIASAGSGTPIMESLAAGGYTFWNMFLGLIPGSVGETSTLAILMGALFLIVNGAANWRIILSVFIGGAVMASVFNIVAPSQASLMSLPAHYHFVMGGFAFGAVFMATDPVSAAATNTGKYIYGFLIGLLAVLVRVLNPAYPEGMMLAILFMNAFSPLIDNVIVWQNIKRRQKRGKE